MSQDFTLTQSFCISDGEDFRRLARAFSSVIQAVDLQGYSVHYGGKTLHQPGRIGVIGPPGSGKSTFVDEAINAFMPEGSKVTEKFVPSHDQSRMVQVWRRWVSEASNKEVRVEDDHACEALAGHRDILLPEMEHSGVSVHEHAAQPESFCDAILRFRYDSEGRRFLDLSVKKAVAQTEAFQKSFLLAIEELQIHSYG